MKRCFISLAALAMVPGVAYAQSDTDQQSVTLQGNVASLCVLGAPSQSSIDLGQLVATSGTRVGRIAAIGDQHVTLPGSFCNFAGTALTVSSDAMLAADSSAVQPGFARAVNYTSSVDNWASTPPTVTTAATAGGGTPNATGTGGVEPLPKVADLDLSLSSFTVPSDALLVAGDYAGSVTITLGPAVSD